MTNREIVAWGLLFGGLLLLVTYGASVGVMERLWQ